MKQNNINSTSSFNSNIIATSNAVPFQGVPLPFNIESQDVLQLLEKAMISDEEVAVVPVVSSPAVSAEPTLCKYGASVKVVKIIDLPDGNKNAFLICQQRIHVTPLLRNSEWCYFGHWKPAPDRLPAAKVKEYSMLMSLIQETYEYIKTYFEELAHVQMAAPRELQDDLKSYLNFIIVTSPIGYSEKVEMLDTADLYKRAQLTAVGLEKLKRQVDLRKEIHSKVSAEIDHEQREHFLRAQIRTIQNEIGEGDQGDIASLKKRIAQMNWPKEMNEVMDKELAKLSRFNPTSPDYAIEYTYIDTLLSLPWNNIKEDEIDINILQEDLEKDHFGLQKVKDRILEHIAVLKLRGDMRSPILCLYGPPGVGKTSLCKSIADSIKRDYARISLGGLHDETQIRGHRRTYIGALPGRIIASLSKIKSNNPVFVLDEIDKIGTDHRGDPAQALLEVLDPEQNHKFHDNYLDVDYDLSKVFFIATANDISTISPPLLDRMELIDISGYLLEEKIEIAKRHLVPKLLESHGFKKNEVKFSDESIVTIIESYTRESGVRRLEKTLARVLRKLALAKAKGEKFKKTIDKAAVLKFLGKEDVLPEIYESNLPKGVVAGLAWTPAGGEILYFESSLSRGKGNVTLTGKMGEVMKESATIALQWIRANAESLGIDPEVFAKTDVHIHVPEGAIPKDGPSAGVTMVTSLVSSFTGKPVAGKLAMTGEATLRGKVLPVGGIKEKILAAKRAGISDIILSAKNRRDIEEIEPAYIEGLRFTYVDTLDEVVDKALGQHAIREANREA